MRTLGGIGWLRSWTSRARDGWRDSDLVRPRLISIVHLLSGSLANMLLMMLSLAIATQTLGLQEFGVMVVVLAIGRVCERLIRFESWQPLVRFVAAEEKKGDRDRVASLYAYGLILDVIAALGAAMLSVAFAWVARSFVGLDDKNVDLVAIYAFAIAFNVRGMASAALRLSGQFRVLAYVQLSSCSFRLGLSALLFVTGGGLTAFVLVWTASQILDSLLFNFLGLRALRSNGIPSPLRADRRRLPQRFPGFLRFAFSTNLTSTMNTLMYEMDTLLVSAFAGPAVAGLYYLARRIAKMAQTVGDLIQTVIYPDLARLWSQADAAAVRKVVTMLQLGLASVALTAIGVCWLIGRPALVFVFGPEFADSHSMLLVQLLAVVLTLHCGPARSALLAMNRPTHVLAAHILSTGVFLVIVFQLIAPYGAIGANIAHVTAAFVLAVIIDVAFWRGMSKHETPAPGYAEAGGSTPSSVTREGRDRPAPPHICSVITSLTSGGAEMLVTNLNMRFPLHGVSASVVAFCNARALGNTERMEAELRDRLEQANCLFRSLGLRPRRGLIEGAFALRRFLRDARPDLIHAHTVRAVLMLALTGYRGPIVFTHHNSRLSFPPWLFRLLDRIVDHYVAISQDTAAIYRCNSTKPFILIPNAPSPAFRASAPRGNCPQRARILTVGAISDQKNYPLLIKTARALRETETPDRPAPTFLIAGGGAGIEGLRRHVRVLGLDDIVEFLGERSDIADLLAQSDIYLNTSRYEGFSVAILEAFACAVPVIATDVPGNRGLVQSGINGILCRNCPSAIATAIARIIRDAAYYRRLSEGAMRSAREYTIEGSARRHVDLYASLMRSPLP